MSGEDVMIFDPGWLQLPRISVSVRSVSVQSIVQGVWFGIFVLSCGLSFSFSLSSVISLKNCVCIGGVIQGFSRVFGCWGTRISCFAARV